MALAKGIDAGPIWSENNKNQRSITPVIMQNLFLPPHERDKRINTILSMILPGPKEPKEMASYLYPLLEEFRLLSKGVQAIDGTSGTEFTLYAYLVLTIGDQQAIRKLMLMRGANSRFGCRACTIEGIHVPGVTVYYYPGLTAHRNGKAAVDIRNLPLRQGLSDDIRRIWAISNAARRETLLEQLGLSSRGFTALLSLPHESINIPRGLP